MTTTEMGNLDRLHEFIGGYKDDRHCLELLRFWSRHSCTRFNNPAVTSGLNGNRLHKERALKRLIGDGIVRQHIENNNCLYSLAEDESLRSLVSELAKFDWSQWQAITVKLCLTCAD